MSESFKSVPLLFYQLTSNQEALVFSMVFLHFCMMFHVTFAAPTCSLSFSSTDRQRAIILDCRRPGTPGNSPPDNTGWDGVCCIQASQLTQSLVDLSSLYTMTLQCTDAGEAFAAYGLILLISTSQWLLFQVITKHVCWRQPNLAAITHFCCIWMESLRRLLYTW